MRHASEVLTEFEVPHECRIVSAHRTPVWLAEYASTAEARGLKVIIAGAGGAAHLPGDGCGADDSAGSWRAGRARRSRGLDSLLSIVQMPSGVPVGTLAIGKAGAMNAALLAIAILATTWPALREQLRQFREQQTASVLGDTTSTLT
jgi:5-(carboxyamino)imidazole ribonucleotide mutase